jgi:hypothetical protein
MTATLTYVYQSTFWLISEGLFCLVSTAALLIAFQIRDGKRQWWRITLMVLFSASAVSVRWAGVLGAIPIVAALIDGQSLRTPFQYWDRRWSSAVITVVFTAFAFFSLRELEQKFETSAESGKFVEELGRMEDPARSGILTTDHIRKTNPDLLPWKFPLAMAVKDLTKGHGWTGGFRSKSVYCVDVRARRK